MEEFKSGFVTVIGKTNVGKSSLINKLTGWGKDFGSYK